MSISDAGSDQAAGLRLFADQSALRLLAWPLIRGETQGCAWASHVAMALQDMGARTLVLDATGGQVARMLGCRRPRKELLDLLAGRATFDEVAEVTTPGVQVVRADAGLEAFVASGGSPDHLLKAFATLSHGFDVMLIAMPIAELASLMVPSRSVPVMVADNRPAAVKEVYGAIKLLSTEFGFCHFALAIHGATDHEEADAIYQRIAHAAGRFLNAGVSLAGWIPAPAEGTARVRTALQHMSQSLLHMAATPVFRH